jgi:hypothetical protein
MLVLILIFAISPVWGNGTLNQTISGAKCKVTDKSKSSVRISYAGMTKSDRLAKSEREPKIHLRLTNRSRCDVYVSTVRHYGSPSRATSKKNEIFFPQDGEEVEIAYVIDNSWGWGDSLKSLRLKRGRSLIFSVPISKLRNAARVEVPVTFDRPLSDSPVSFSATLMLDTLPAAVHRTIYQ